MLTEEEKSTQHTEVLLKGKEVQRPYFFYNDCLMIEDVVADAGTYLAQVDSQMEEGEQEHLLKDVKDRLLKKDDKLVVINNNQEEVDRCRK